MGVVAAIIKICHLFTGKIVQNQVIKVFHVVIEFHITQGIFMLHVVAFVTMENINDTLTIVILADKGKVSKIIKKAPIKHNKIPNVSPAMKTVFFLH